MCVLSRSCSLGLPCPPWWRESPLTRLLLGVPSLQPRSFFKENLPCPIDQSRRAGGAPSKGPLGPAVFYTFLLGSIGWERRMGHTQGQGHSRSPPRAPGLPRTGVGKDMPGPGPSSPRTPSGRRLRPGRAGRWTHHHELPRGETRPGETSG